MSTSDSNQTPARALLLVNRASRAGAGNADRAAEILRSLEVDVIFEDMTDPQTTRAAIQRHAADVDRIIVGGGDGSINMTAGALIEADVPVGLLPLGTANDLARSLQIPADLDAACRIAVGGTVHAIDIGQCNDVYFVNVASLGVPVRASRYRSTAAKRWLGPLGYLTNVTQAFRDTRPFHADLVWDGQTRRVHTIQLVVGNGRHFGGGLAVAPDARIDDGQLDIYSLDPQSAWSMIGKLPALIRGPDNTVQGVQLFQTDALRVDTRKPVEINTDGEVLTKTPADFRLICRALSILVPDAYLDGG